MVLTRSKIGIFLIGLLLWTHSAIAAETIVSRGGQHSNYSRLVFEGDNSFSYEITKENNQTLKLSFNKNASLETQDVDTNALRSINALTVSTTSPLVVSIGITSGSTYKHFKIKNKLVLDVVAGNNTQPAPAVPKASAKPQEKPQNLSAQSAPKVPAPEVEKEVPKTEAPALIKKVEPVEEGTKLLSTASNKPNLISLSTITPTSMAIFELNNKIWMVNGNEKAIISPQVTGKQRNDIQPIVPLKNKAAKIFTTNTLKGAELLTQGGGLVWRLLIGNDLEKDTYVPAKRINENEADLGGGKIIWPFIAPEEIIDVIDPNTGVTIKVITVAASEDYAGPAIDFVDFTALRSPLGLAIIPKRDDLSVEITEEGVLISRPNGLALSSQSSIDLAKAKTLRVKQRDAGKNAPKVEQIYDFENWQLGGVPALDGNKTVILASLPNLAPTARAEKLLNLGKMYVAAGMGAEATGFFEMASDAIPEMTTNPIFKAIKGVALALNNQNEDAFKMLSDDAIQNKPEVLNWRSFTLANLQDWQQAESLLPASFETIESYPAEVAIPLSLVLAEVALRAGDLERSGKLFNIARQHEDDMRYAQAATFKYLKGEQARQNGDVDLAIQYWKDLAEGNDDFYRVKAGLALTRLEQNKKDLSLTEAVDRLERLRYAWRGDDLEAQVNYWLGRIYFDRGDYVKGLNLMRDSAGYATGPDVGKGIIEEMSEEFVNLFKSERLNTLPAPDAVAIYERFSELNPSNEVGDRIAQKLADRLVKANLYDKAVEILAYQVENRLSGMEAFRVSKRLAAIHLLNDNPVQAIATLKKADLLRAELPEIAEDKSVTNDLTMLKAQALSQNDLPQQALALLRTVPATPKNNLLYAEIAWEHDYWDDAAIALQNVIEDEGTSLSRKLTDKQAELVLQRAVALSLANDRIRLANMREKYSRAMDATDKGRAFEVITRIRQNADLADRQTLLSIVSEVDLFSNILEEEVQESSDLNPPQPPAEGSSQSSAASTQ